ncbi:hypothetical protein D3C75_273110 [compost metagenome]
MGLFSKKKDRRFQVSLRHVEGLPLAEGTMCIVVLESDKLIITGGGAEYTMEISQLRAIEAKTDVEIAHIVKSSAAKGVAGGLLFGPIGLVVGSRATSKEKRTVTVYAIVNYINSDGDLAVLMFNDLPNTYSASKLVNKVRPLIPQTQAQSYKL